MKHFGQWSSTNLLKISELLPPLRVFNKVMLMEIILRSYLEIIDF